MFDQLKVITMIFMLTLMIIQISLVTEIRMKLILGTAIYNDDYDCDDYDNCENVHVDDDGDNDL